MDILERIVAQQAQDLIRRKQSFPESYWESAPLFNRPCISLKSALNESSTGIIAEFKRRSPSKPSINFKAQVSEVASEYQAAGISGMSVLTNGPFFGGSLEDLSQARASANMPLLRKEFVIDPYQITEAKAHGADVILLIAACLEPARLRMLAKKTKSLGMEVLLEVHNEAELQANLIPEVDLIGVNNRNLKTFTVNVQTSLDLLQQIPQEFTPISESGLSDPKTVAMLGQAGFKGFLMGEHFMRSENPGEAAAAFVNALKNQRNED
ncbi:indole-3-glycerol phosphate synthase TrpC [Gilvibacter sp.]|uniref:indole-3-glycerol phosphate synthase TrpC n=1 Tax=Gilvibacter sp. TaxID=2729997 RepID=UPI003B518F94